MSHPVKKLWLVPLAVLTLASLTGLAHAGSISLGYDGAGVYPVEASANSERYFRVVVSWQPASETVASVTLSGPSGQTTLVPDPIPGSYSDGVAFYRQSSGSTTVDVYTIGPYAGRDIFDNPHKEIIGLVSQDDGSTAFPFTFNAVFLDSSGNASSASASGSYYTQHDNSDLLQWFSGQATGVDPLGVTDAPDITADNGSSSSRYTFRVQYKILEGFHRNLLPRFGQDAAPPGPYGTYVDMDFGRTFAFQMGDRDQDWWTYHAWQDDFADRTGYNINYKFPEVVLIIDGDRSRPHFMVRDDEGDGNALDSNGVRYRYDVLPTDYANFMDNIWLFTFDPLGTDDWDGYPSGLNGRQVSNNYVAFTAGGHTYEFLASDDFSPCNYNRAWVQVGRPGNGLYNDYIRTLPGTGGQVASDIAPGAYPAAFTRFVDSDGAAGGYGYPYDSQDTTRYPDVNPVLSAHPYFPNMTIDPGYDGGSLGPDVPGAAPNPFPAEVGAGPNPPQRFTNDDTILPNFVNIRPNSDPEAPFRGGKWTNSSTYTFRINYWQSNNVAPKFVKVFIRKNNDGAAAGSWRSYTMQKLNAADNTYSDGCVYQFQATPEQLPDLGGPGDYNYYFQADDGIRTAVFPNRPATPPSLWDPADIGVPLASDGTNDYYSFRVNTPPVLSNQSVTAPSGRVGDNFQFRVTYTDTDGELLNTSSRGDRPFETSIYIDLFGNYQGQATVTGVPAADTLQYSVAEGSGYDTDELAGLNVEIETGAAAGRTYQIVSNDATTITLVGGTDLIADGVAAGARFRVADWFRATMKPADASDDDYSDGKEYVFDTATIVELGPGLHRYYFVFRDDWGSWLYPDDSNTKVEGEAVRFPNTGAIEGPEVAPNTPPVLSNFRFTPDAASGPDGTTATAFIFSVTYTDADNNPPAVIRLAIDGNADGSGATVLDMDPEKPSDDVYHDGATFRTPPIRLAEGAHIFRAQASDGFARFPASDPGDPFLFSGPPDPANPGTNLDSVEGPLVAANTRPVLSFLPDDDGSDPTNPPGLDPNVGRQTTEFTYTVVYTDTDRYAGVAGNPPDYIRVVIDSTSKYDMSKVDPNDNDYTDGVVYAFKISGLVEGTPHQYYFEASDGLDRDRLPDFGAVPNYFSGPVVDEPPGAPQSLLAQDTPSDNGGSISLTWNPSLDDGGGADDVVEYHVYRSETSGSYGPGDQIASVPATGAAAYTYDDTSAVTGTQYFYIVRAADPSSESANSNEAGPVSAIDNIVPQPPTDVEATNPGLGGTINLTWTLSTDDGAGNNDVQEYRIYRSTTTSFAPPAIATVAAGTDSYQDTTATDGTAYYYMLRAFDGSNLSADSNVAGPVTPTDEQAPVIDNLSPADGATGVPTDTAISFRVSDTGSGVNRSTVTASATIGGNPIDLGTPTVTGSTDSYNFRYQPTDVLPFLADVTVTVTAEDNGGKSASITWSFTVSGPPTYQISGRVALSDGTGVPDVVVTADGHSATTDGAGDYVITGLSDGTYTVTPVLRGYAFAPAEVSVTVPESAAGVDFIATPAYDIAGRVFDKQRQPLPGVTVSDGVRSVVTDSEGRWRLKDTPPGTYNITPSLALWEFEPTTRQVVVTDDNVLGQDFIGQLASHNVSGTVTDVDGNRVQGVTVEAEQNGTVVTATTDASGQYTLRRLLPGTWTITPSKSGYSFEPADRVLDLSGDVSGVDFEAIPVYSLRLPAGLSFVALPISPFDEHPSRAFGATADVIRYDPTASPPRYLVADPTSNTVPQALRLRAGRGFWVRVPAATVLDVPGNSVPSNQQFILNLSNGWNMAGNPFDADLPWSNLDIGSGSPVRDFGYIYDRATRGYILVSDLPGLGAATSVPRLAGMWMRSSALQSVTVNPLTAAAAPAQTYVRAEGDFVIPIVAEAGGSADRTARVGVMGYAKANPGAYDIENPPALKSYVDVYFPTAADQRMACDIRGEATQSMSFKFVVATDLANTQVKLSLPDLTQVPRDKSVTLVDVAAGKRIYARTAPSYVFDSGNGEPREFRLEIGPAVAAGGLVVTGTAAQKAGQGLGITYTLSRQARVTITVMNLSGRTVRTLGGDQLVTAGVNQTTWDLRSASGTAVPAGRYLVRIQAVTEDGQQASCLVPANVAR